MLTRFSCRVERYKVLWTMPRQSSSTSAGKRSRLYPYPTHWNPSPHQIFHLPRAASESDIKTRYFELVRIYHPDKADPAIPSEEAHARFQSIKAAYDTLREKTPLTKSPLSQSTRYPSAAAWRARIRHQELYARKDENWKDYVILAGIVATFLVLVAQVLTTRRRALNEATIRTYRLGPLRNGRIPVVASTLDPNDSDRRLGE